MVKRILSVLAALGLLAVVATPVAAHDRSHHENEYEVHNLVSDGGVHAKLTDANLVNGWGLTAGPTTPWWVANNGTGTSTLYDGTGAPRPLIVSVPGGPTGAVFNGTSDFGVSGGGASGPARFLFATEGGQILGWNPNVPAAGSTQTELGANRANVGAIYKGLATGSVGGKNYLYATDFHNGRIDVFDATFTLQNWAGTFVDPKLPHGYAPFGIQNLNGLIFVTYAKQDAAREDEIAGRGRGFVSMFGPGGTFLGRVASRGALDAPWGLAWAPQDFGKFGGDLLVGNFGNGRLNAYAPTKHGWRFEGTLRREHGRAIVVDGLWGIGFGNGVASGPTNTLYFAAGPGDESHGLFGSITVDND
ncbi:MAG: TIGR03118 family protein [Candidatus Limnocylindrales bacterium]